MSCNCKQADVQTFIDRCQRPGNDLSPPDSQRTMMPSEPQHEDTGTRMTSWSVVAGLALISLVLIILTIHALARTTA